MTTPKPPSQPGCQWAEECIEICNSTSVFVEERGVRATFLNPQIEIIRKIHYDGCYNKTPGTRQSDFIVGKPNQIDVIVELKGSDTNLKKAALQVECTLLAWREDPNRCGRIAGLIIFGCIQGKKKRPGRRPKAESMVQAVRLDFLRRNKTLLLIHENGERQFTFNDFLRKSNAR